MSGGDRVTVVGDALLDIDAEGPSTRLSGDDDAPVIDEERVRMRPGGAGLAATLAARDGWRVTLVTALSRDEHGDVLRAALGAEGVEVIDLGLAGPTPQKMRIRIAGRTHARLDRGGPASAVGASGGRDLDLKGTVIVSDYGRGVAAARNVRRALARARTVVWDPHPRGAPPLGSVTVVTPNESEVAAACDRDPPHASDALRRALARWNVPVGCMTRGDRGALLVDGSGPAVAFPAPRVDVLDACGAGDRFAVSLAGALARGVSLRDAVADAVHAASAYVAGGTPIERDGLDEALALARSVRSQGGTVVATGGCFDLLHPGHLTTLRAARQLGDCLIVCLNSDASVRALKGDGRPVAPASDRAALLADLRWVDAVVTFDDATPARLLDALRPAIWVKGADYEHAPLDEGAAVAAWGGEVVLSSCLPGHSTTAKLVALGGEAARQRPAVSPRQPG